MDPMEKAYEAYRDHTWERGLVAMDFAQWAKLQKGPRSRIILEGTPTHITLQLNQFLNDQYGYGEVAESGPKDSSLSVSLITPQVSREDLGGPIRSLEGMRVRVTLEIFPEGFQDV